MSYVPPTDVDTSLTAAELEKLYELAAGKRCLELGAWKGASAIAMAQSAEIVHTVDWFRGDPHSGEAWTLADHLNNVSNYGLEDKIITHIGRFETVVPALAEDYFDLVFVDGYHAQDEVETDIALALPKARHGGTFAFHDYRDDVDGFGVPAAVRVFFGDPPSNQVDSLAIVEYGFVNSARG